MSLTADDREALAGIGYLAPDGRANRKLLAEAIAGILRADHVINDTGLDWKELRDEAKSFGASSGDILGALGLTSGSTGLHALVTDLTRQGGMVAKALPERWSLGTCSVERWYNFSPPHSGGMWSRTTVRYVRRPAFEFEEPEYPPLRAV